MAIKKSELYSTLWKSCDELRGGMDACPSLQSTLFTQHKMRKGYYSLNCKVGDIRNIIRNHPDFIKQTDAYHRQFEKWRHRMYPKLEKLSFNVNPKNLIQELGDAILETYSGNVTLVEGYDVYEQLLTYWNETMQDDVYLISADGWKAEPYTP